MRKNYEADRERLLSALASYGREVQPLAILEDPAIRETLVEQIIDSEQRVGYTDRLLRRELDPTSTHPSSDGFDPLKAAVLHAANGELDEAVWMVFLFVHFGKHKKAGWRYARDVYGRLGSGELWTWAAVSNDTTAFRFWLHENRNTLTAAPGPRGFGNHRKYQSLDAWSETGTGAAVESYVDWVHSGGEGHKQRFEMVDGLDKEAAFDALYRSLDAVKSFGRVARFDYLSMLMKLRLLDICPPHSYLVGATGPLSGARLLLNADPAAGRARDVQHSLKVLGDAIGVRPDVLEDAVCNWQKSPDSYVRFSG